MHYKYKDPDTGEVYTSSIKSLGEPVVGPNINMDNHTFYTETLDPANEEEIADALTPVEDSSFNWLVIIIPVVVIITGVVIFIIVKKRREDEYYD